VTDTYFVVAHFHYIMVGGMVLAFMGGLHYWWPKITGRMYPEHAGRMAAIVTFIGFNLTFFPQFVMGYLGMPRRYQSYPEEFSSTISYRRQAQASWGSDISCRSSTFWSLKRGPRAPANPWHATGLEWKTPSPPPTDNFEITPIVTEGAYTIPNRRAHPKRLANPDEVERIGNINNSMSEHAHRRLDERGDVIYHHFATAAQQSATPQNLACGCFLPQRFLFFGVLFMGYTYLRWSRPACRARVQYTS